MAQRKSFNPFYALLVVAGVAFCVSACAYGVTAMRDLRTSPTERGPQRAHVLTAWFRTNGETLLVGELLVLAVGTVGAISTDGYWTRRAEAAGRRGPDASPRSAGETNPTDPLEE